MLKRGSRWVMELIYERSSLDVLNGSAARAYFLVSVDLCHRERSLFFFSQRSR